MPLSCALKALSAKQFLDRRARSNLKKASKREKIKTEPIASQLKPTTSPSKKEQFLLSCEPYQPRKPPVCCWEANFHKPSATTTSQPAMDNHLATNT